MTLDPGETRSVEAKAQLHPGTELPTRDEAASALAVLRRPGFGATIVGLSLITSLAAFARFGWTPAMWLVVPLLVTLVIILVLDIRTKIIPDLITLPGIGYALIVAAFAEPHVLWQAALGALTGGGVVLLLAAISRGAVGGGDVKLTAMLGAWLGWKSALAVLAISQLAAALVAMTLLTMRRANIHDSVPVGALIAFVGAVVVLGAR